MWAHWPIVLTVMILKKKKNVELDLELVIFFNFIRVLGAGNPQPISGPCSIEIMYPQAWRIAIPAPLMRLDYDKLLSVFGQTLRPSMH